MKMDREEVALQILIAIVGVNGPTRDESVLNTQIDQALLYADKFLKTVKATK